VAKESYDRLLFGEGRRDIETSPAIYFIIGPDRYAPNWYYEGRYQFEKHAIPGMVGELKPEGDEFDCAQYIDSQVPQVRRWVRNLANKPECSFYLWTSTDRFYPDFVAELGDGRILVVEYKRENDWSNDDSREKRAAGELWADRSGGRCLFIMPKGRDFQAIESAAR
jgi:type III restriction enzyme